MVCSCFLQDSVKTLSSQVIYSCLLNISMLTSRKGSPSHSWGPGAKVTRENQQELPEYGTNGAEELAFGRRTATREYWFQGRIKAVNCTSRPARLRARTNVSTGPIMLNTVFSSTPSHMRRSLDLRHSPDFTAALVLNLKGWNTLPPSSYKFLFGNTFLVYSSQLLSWWGIQRET